MKEKSTYKHTMKKRWKQRRHQRQWTLYRVWANRDRLTKRKRVRIRQKKWMKCRKNMENKINIHSECLWSLKRESRASFHTHSIFQTKNITRKKEQTKKTIIVRSKSAEKWHKTTRKKQTANSSQMKIQSVWTANVDF